MEGPVSPRLAGIFIAVLIVHAIVAAIVFGSYKAAGPQAEQAAAEQAARPPAPVDEVAPPPPAGDVQYELYTVRSGDNLTVIARKHGITVSELKALNDVSGDIVHPNQRLRVPKTAPR